MTELELDLLLVIAELVRIKVFIFILLLFFFILYKKKFKKAVKLIFGLYLVLFFAFFTINTYGSDLITLVFLKKKLTPESFTVFKKDISLKKDLKDKIIMSYALSHDIKYMIKSLEEEYDEVQEELKNLKDIERNFIPHNETAEII